MLEIGQTRLVVVKTKVGKRGKLRPVLEGGEPVKRVVTAEVWRETRDTLPGHFCRDKNRKLIVGFRAGDLLVMRPKGTRQEVAVDLKDVYAWALRSRAMRSQLEKAREKKAAIDARRAERRQAAHTRKLAREAMAQR